ncbi:hypothetical protein L0337_32075 [candidate division KSB1 bacterium]|nr:hypothetical protein [candidate division KSB1 bacterium]
MQYTATGQTVTLHLPDFLYQRVERVAKSSRRPVEEVLLDAVSTALPPLAGLPPELADELADLAFLSDAELWEIARKTLSAEHYEEMDDLLKRKGQNQLTADEQQTLDRLLQEYQTLVLHRGQAAVLLQRRGYNMPDPALLNPVP